MSLSELEQGISAIKFDGGEDKGREILSKHFKAINIWPGGVREEDGFIYTVRGRLNGLVEDLQKEGVVFRSEYLKITQKLPERACELWERLPGWVNLRDELKVNTED